jgi:hypothetical protein
MMPFFSWMKRVHCHHHRDIKNPVITKPNFDNWQDQPNYCFLCFQQMNYDVNLYVPVTKHNYTLYKKVNKGAINMSTSISFGCKNNIQ